MSLDTAAVYRPSIDYSTLAVPGLRLLRQLMPMGYANNIVRLRKQRGLTQAQLAELMKVEQPTVQRWESGAREMSASKIIEAAEVLGVSPGELMNPEAVVPLGPTLQVKGSVAAGVWKEAHDWPRDEWQTFTGRPDVSYPVARRFGLRVDGDSMNEIYPPGTIIECVSFDGGADLHHGRRVVVLRRRDDGTVEATVKEYREDRDGSRWLWPRSSNPAFQTPIRVDQKEAGILETSIVAVVVSSTRPE